MRSYLDSLNGVSGTVGCSERCSDAHARQKLVAEVVTAFSASDPSQDPAVGKDPETGPDGMDVKAEMPPAAPAPKDKDLPPIHCESNGAQDYLDVVRKEANGEKSQGRGIAAPEEEEGPATNALLELLEPSAAAKRMAKLAAKAKNKPKYVEDITKETPWKIEKIRRQLPKKMKPKPKPKLGLGGESHSPELCSRNELVEEGPFPLEKRLSELAGHAYYLWGDAKYLAYKAEGTNVEATAMTVERFANLAQGAARAACKNGHIPMSNMSPYLPLSISSMPLTLSVAALGIRLERRKQERLERYHFL